MKEDGIREKLLENLEIITEFLGNDDCQTIDIPLDFFFSKINPKEKIFIVLDRFREPFRYKIGIMAHVYGQSLSNKKLIIKSSVVLSEETETEIFKRNREQIVDAILRNENL